MTTKREKLSGEELDAFVGDHAGWRVEDGALTKLFVFDDYGASMAFAVHIGLAAQKRDHHPDLRISWGKVTVAWSTHDAGGMTALDTEMAGLTDKVYGG